MLKQKLRESLMEALKDEVKKSTTRDTDTEITYLQVESNVLIYGRYFHGDQMRADVLCPLSQIKEIVINLEDNGQTSIRLGTSDGSFILHYKTKEKATSHVELIKEAYFAYHRER